MKIPSLFLSPHCSWLYKGFTGVNAWFCNSLSGDQSTWATLGLCISRVPDASLLYLLRLDVFLQASDRLLVDLLVLGN